jgi:branched-chain amino acid transport system permease protein
MSDDRLGRRNPIVETLFNNWPYVLAIIFFWRFPYLVAEWSNSNVDGPIGDSVFWQAIMIEVFILCLLALSYNLMFGYTGLISLGHAMFFGFGAYSVAILVKTYERTFMEAVIGTLAFSVILALIWAVAAFRLKSVYFAMFTLAIAEVAFALTTLTLFSHITNGEDGFLWRTEIPDWINPRAPAGRVPGNRLTQYYVVMGVVFLSYFLVRRLMNSPSGKAIIAIRENETRAQTLGFNVYLYKMLAIIVSGLLATLAGIMHAIAPFTISVTPNAYGLERTIDPLLHTLIGGTGTIPGPFIGAFLLRVGENFLREPEVFVDLRFIIGRYTTTIDGEEYWPLMLGATFVVFVLLVPYGIVGEINRIWLDARRWIRNYLYNPLVYRFPRLATLAKPLTGEPPEKAIALAQRNPNPDYLGWLKSHPSAAMNSFTLIFVAVVTLATFDWRVGVEWLLFWVLISLPIRILVLLYRGWRRFVEMRESGQPEATVTQSVEDGQTSTAQ